jgi:hypothetical protein
MFDELLHYPGGHPAARQYLEALLPLDTAHAQPCCPRISLAPQTADPSPVYGLSKVSYFWEKYPPKYVPAK